MTKILVVDDELKIARLVRDYLIEAGFDVVTAADGQSALGLFRTDSPDLVVLDIGLPGMDGLDITRRIRGVSNTPIIMLTARSDETDRIVGLEMGADDYVVKPFSPREVVARVKAVLRRGSVPPATHRFVIRDLTIDESRRSVTKDGSHVQLTATEFDLLAALAGQPGRVFTRSQLLDAIRGVSFDSYERAIDSHIKNLRKKLAADSNESPYIETVYGIGYRFSDEE